MKRFAIVLPWAGLLAMTSIAWACDSTPQAAAKGACSVAATKAKTKAVAAAACPTTPTCHGASCCAAMGTAQAATAAPAKTTASAPAAAGMRVYRDPETGELTSTPSAADAAAAAKEAELGDATRSEPVQTVLPDGSVMLELNGHGQEYFIMEKDKDGNLVTRCVQDPKAAAQAPVAPAKPEDK